jgi:sec-independent protein translocase protein TatA
MFTQIGPLEIGIVLVIALLVLGPKRLPGLGKSLGTGMREFKDSISGNTGHEEVEGVMPEPSASRLLPEGPVPATVPTAVDPERQTASPRSGVN